MPTIPTDIGFALPRKKVSLRALFPQGHYLNCEDIIIESITANSKLATGNVLFVAKRGAKADGHDYVNEAMTNGCQAILTERPIPKISIPQCVVRDTRQAYGQLAQAIYGQPAQQLKIVGVTGTNGKSTTTWYLRHLLSQLGNPCGLLGTITHHDGSEEITSQMTTPDALEIAELQARMVGRGTRYLAMEVSSHALDQERLAGMSLDAAVMTNLTHDHLDYHQTFANYVATKARILNLVKSGAMTHLNGDDETLAELAKQKNNCLIQTFGMQPQSQLRATPHVVSLDGSQIEIHYQHRSQTTWLPAIGPHNISNVLGAVSVLLQWGFDFEQVVSLIPQLPTVPGRLEAVAVGQPFHVFVDYAHTPDALENVLRCLRPLTPGRLICVMGAGGDRDKTKRPLMGKAGTLADVLVITSDNPRSEDPGTILAEIAAGCPQNQSQIELIIDRTDAIQFVCELAGADDVVLIAGKGHEATQTIGTQVLPFNDREMTAQILQKQHPRHMTARPHFTSASTPRIYSN